MNIDLGTTLKSFWLKIQVFDIVAKSLIFLAHYFGHNMDPFFVVESVRRAKSYVTMCSATTTQIPISELWKLNHKQFRKRTNELLHFSLEI
jgi:hypothetical protein